MSSGIASLHKVLKDETRRRILLLLHEKGSLGYVDLMKAIRITSTGKMNYHLKVLNNLILKKEDGQYALTEKGELSLRLMLAYPEEVSQQSGKKPEWWRRFWIGVVISTTVTIAIYLVSYFLGYIDLSELGQKLLWMLGAIGIVYMVRHITRDVLSEKSQLLFNKINYIILGAWLGLTVSFFGVGFLSLLSMRLGGPNYFIIFIDNTFTTVLFLIVPPIIGGIAGYRFGKKRNFKRPEPKLWGHKL
jgi:hypothetical protein